jgi:glycosyltransferase involved in cell wall biosynthesis
MTADVTAIVTCMTDVERETLQSVQNQTLPCETIVVVLESNTWINDIAAEFPHFRVMRRPPGWEGAARHTGIAAARTALVAFLDGDDVWLPETKKQVDFLRDGRRDFVRFSTNSERALAPLSPSPRFQHHRRAARRLRATT